MEKRQKYEAMFQNSRTNILLFTILTAANCIMILFKLDFSFSFAGIFPVLSIVYGREFGQMSGNTTYQILGYAIAVLFLVLLLMVYFTTRTHRSFIYVGLGIFIFECLALGYYIYLGFMITDVIDILFHIWFGYYVITGVIAHEKLKGYASETLEDAEKTESPEEEDNASYDDEPETEDSGSEG